MFSSAAAAVCSPGPKQGQGGDPEHTEARRYHGPGPRTRGDNEAMEAAVPGAPPGPRRFVETASRKSRGLSSRNVGRLRGRPAAGEHNGVRSELARIGLKGPGLPNHAINSPESRLIWDRRSMAQETVDQIGHMLEGSAASGRQFEQMAWRLIT